MTVENQIHRIGKRKEAVARVYLRPKAGEEGVITVNKRSFEDYFPRETARRLILQPLELTDKVGVYDIYINVHGGGLSGQAGAVKHGISRALDEAHPDMHVPLRRGGHLTRDARTVERKKYGLAKARKSFQFSKR
jgi:small subunit ribosomal protein S9